MALWLKTLQLIECRDWVVAYVGARSAAGVAVLRLCRVRIIRDEWYKRQCVQTVKKEIKGTVYVCQLVIKSFHRSFAQIYKVYNSNNELDK